MGKKSLLVMNEPTRGLHDHDVVLLMKSLIRLKNLSITCIIIEHHSEVAQHADWLIDIGPGAASRGGKLLFQGPPQDLLQVALSKTKDYFSVS